MLREVEFANNYGIVFREEDETLIQLFERWTRMVKF